MSFEYNGFIHRDLEPQVRYDAEQIQLLKQADVTINESLQTVNTELNGKLTKPTNPSAESAVTMLADGTVGTKLLSEIGGGTVYLHKITFEAYGVSGLNAGGRIDIQFERHSSSSTTATSDDFYNLFSKNIPAVGSLSTSHGNAICVMRCTPKSVSPQGTVYPGRILEADIYFADSNPTGSIVDNSGLIKGVDLTKITESTDPPAYPIRFYSDTVIEL